MLGEIKQANNNLTRKYMVKKIITTSVLLCGLILLSGCSSEKSNNEIASTENLNRCENASEYIVKKIEGGLNTKGITLRDVKVVKSNDYESVYFISGDLEGPGLDGKNEIATFATNKLDATGLTFSVDAIADEFSDWPLGTNTDFNMTMNNDGAKESKDCLAK